MKSKTEDIVKGTIGDRMRSSGDFKKITNQELKLINQEREKKQTAKSTLTQQQIYAYYLNSLPNLLHQFMFDIYDVLSNLAMAGELSDVNSGFDISCELMFMIDDFRNLNDQNVQMLYQIYDFIHMKKASIININALKTKDE